MQGCAYINGYIHYVSKPMSKIYITLQYSIDNLHTFCLGLPLAQTRSQHFANIPVISAVDVPAPLCIKTTTKSLLAFLTNAVFRIL